MSITKKVRTGSRMRLFIIGLFIFFIIQFFAPNKIFYFASYYIAFIFFFLAVKDIAVSLILSLILALFSDIGLASSYFKLQPEFLNLGSGYWISSLTILLLNLLFLSIFRKIKKITLADYALLLFFLWSVIFNLFFPEPNIIYGLLRLAEGLLVYYLLRIYLRRKHFKYIAYIFIFLLIFQVFLSVNQFLFSRNIGILLEGVNIGDPYGITAVEESSLFRASGSFTHPNYLASFLITMMPFILLIPGRAWYILIFILMLYISLFLTFSRAGWAIGLIQTTVYLFRKKLIIPRKIKPSIIGIMVLIPIMIYFLFPHLSARLQSLNQALTSGGSFDTRYKLFQEGFNIISKFPLTGIGLNYSTIYYMFNPVTDLYLLIPNIGNYRLHNLFLEITAETGLVGLFIFLAFLSSIIKNYFDHRIKEERSFNEKFRQASFWGFLSLLFISMFNPFLQATLFRLFFLMAAIILV